MDLFRECPHPSTPILCPCTPTHVPVLPSHVPAPPCHPPVPTDPPRLPRYSPERLHRSRSCQPLDQPRHGRRQSGEPPPGDTVSPPRRQCRADACVPPPRRPAEPFERRDRAETLPDRLQGHAGRRQSGADGDWGWGIFFLGGGVGGTGMMPPPCCDTPVCTPAEPAKQILRQLGEHGERLGGHQEGGGNFGVLPPPPKAHLCSSSSPHTHGWQGLR